MEVLDSVANERAGPQQDRATSGNLVSVNSTIRGPGRPVHGDTSKHDALLAAARKYFLVKQYKRVTTREIAVEAGVDIGLIPYYFHNLSLIHILRCPRTTLFCSRCAPFP